MKKFKKLDPEIIKEPVNALFKKLGKEITHISFLGRGEGSAVFKIVTPENTYCLKTALFPERSQKVLNEATIRNNFIKRGIQCVPPPFYSDRDYFTHGAVVYDYIEGELSKFDSKNIIQQMAYHLAEIHKLEYTINPNGYEQALGNHRSLKDIMHHIETDYPHLINSSISEAFSRALDEYKEFLLTHQDLFPFGISGILHGDLSDNFITDPNGKLWLIDWENSEHGDILEDLGPFVFDNDIEGEDREFFFQEYKKHFPPAEPLDLEQIGLSYIQVMPAFNICFGMDQFNSNLVHHLDPERKLRDIALSARNWELFFSPQTTALIKQGVADLTEKLVREHNLQL